MSTTVRIRYHIKKKTGEPKAVIVKKAKIVTDGNKKILKETRGFYPVTSAPGMTDLRAEAESDDVRTS